MSAKIQHPGKLRRTGRLRKIGIALTTLIAFQVVSAWFLYYLANEEVRQWIVNFHLASGSSIPLLIVLHLIFGKRTTAAT
tara:strand:+ start:93461 stop:93700 length:240 start_codon:yes stop_codon:yes gene_type:complete